MASLNTISIAYAAVGPTNAQSWHAGDWGPENYNSVSLSLDDEAHLPVTESVFDSTVDENGCLAVRPGDLISLTSCSGHSVPLPFGA